MLIDYDLQKINATFSDFCNATGIDIGLLKNDFSPVCDKFLQNIRYCDTIQNSPKGKNACKCSDASLIEKCKASKTAQMHICHAGLTDIAIPILHNDTIIGYIIIGRIKSDTDFSVLKPYIASLGIDTETAATCYNEIPFFDKDRIHSITNIATMLVKYILLENILKPVSNDTMDKAITYIHSNLQNDLSVKAVSKNINVSKSVLYAKFHEHFDCTLSEYIKKKRIEKSIELLENTNYTIEEISQKVGFSSASYYSKTFKKQLNISPLKYKKKKMSNET